MSVFTHRLNKGIANACLLRIDRKSNPLGNVATDEERFRILIDEGGSDSLSSEVMQHSSDVLIYAGSDFPRDCVGAQIHVDGGRDFRVDSYNVAKNQRTGKVEHIELKCSEQI